MSALFCLGQSSVAQPAWFASWHLSRLASAAEQPASPAALRMLAQKASQLEADGEATHILQTRRHVAELSAAALLLAPVLVLLDGAVDGALDDLPAAAVSAVPASGSS